MPWAAPGSGVAPGLLPVPVVARLGVGGVLLGAARKEHTLCGTAASPCRFQGLSQTLPMAVPPDPMQSGFWGPLFTSSFSCHPSQQPGKVGPPVPMFLTGMWKPRREPVEASRIQNTSV